MKQISSVQNPLVKHLLQLQDKSRTRRQTGTFLMEGLREVSLAVAGGYTIETVLFDPSLADPDVAQQLAPDADCIEISHEVYRKLAYRDSTEGLLAVGREKPHGLDTLLLGDNPLILVAEAPEKPGNIGALLRTADAAHLDAVIIANPKTDLYNPNIIRSSVGCLFTVPTVTGTTEEIIEYLSKHEIALYAAILQYAVAYHTQDFTGPTAIAVGTEAIGLSEEWRRASRQNIIIPMQGAIDSMNVSVAAAVLIFEAKRQRQFR